MKFLCAFKKGNDPVRYLPNCSTQDGFLLDAKGRPCFLASIVDANGWRNELSGKKLAQIIGTKYEIALIRFGKHPDYWVWNEDARQKKAVETSKTVLFREKTLSPYDDDETEYRLVTELRYLPKDVSIAVTANCYKDGSRYILNNPFSLRQSLASLGWAAEIK